MLKILNELRPFIEDNYRRIHVREYAKMQHISPPTASQRLEQCRKEGLLNIEKDKRHHLYSANRANSTFITLARAYWNATLQRSGLIDSLSHDLLSPVIILFGSLAKGETKKDSDIDLAVFTPSPKKLDISKYEQKLGRPIQLFLFKDRASAGKDLLNNILNGHVLRGNW